jgi:hypothetical protein
VSWKNIYEHKRAERWTALTTYSFLVRSVARILNTRKWLVRSFLTSKARETRCGLGIMLYTKTSPTTAANFEKGISESPSGMSKSVECLQCACFSNQAGDFSQHDSARGFGRHFPSNHTSQPALATSSPTRIMILCQNYRN